LLDFPTLSLADDLFAGKVKFALKGIKAHATVFKQKKVEGTFSKEDLESLVALQTEALH
jgi:hypothetical protein